MIVYHDITNVKKFNHQIINQMPLSFKGFAIYGNCTKPAFVGDTNWIFSFNSFKNTPRFLFFAVRAANSARFIEFDLQCKTS